MKQPYACLALLALSVLLPGCAVVPYDDPYASYSYPYGYGYPAYSPAYVGPPVDFSLGIGFYSGGGGGHHHGGWHGHGGGGGHGHHH